MEKKKKLAYAKSVDNEKKTVTAYVSTYEWDRTDEKFAPGAWDLENFKKNPVVLWGHDGSNPPIGRAIDIREDEKGLLAVAEFDVESERGAEIFGLYERGFLNAFSVGFIPKSHTVEPIPDRNTKGVVWTNSELLEFSAVSIPANPGAVIGRELAEIAIKCLGDGAVTKSEGGGEFIVSPFVEKKAEETPEAKMESAVNELIKMARVVKGKPLDKSKLALLGTATAVLNEIVAEQEATPEDVERLHNIVKELAEVVTAANASTEGLLGKLLSNIEKALK